MVRVKSPLSCVWCRNEAFINNSFQQRTCPDQSGCRAGCEGNGQVVVPELLQGTPVGHWSCF